MAGVLSLIAAAQALAKQPETERQIIFTLFNGEAWGYLGSKRLIHDIDTFQCTTAGAANSCAEPVATNMAFKNISMANIKAIIELGHLSNSKNLFAHTGGFAQSESLRAIVLDQLSQFADARATSVELPPSSLHTFLRRAAIPAVLLTDFNTSYPK